MGRVRTKTVKKASRVIIEKYYPRLTLDFQTNKRVCAEVAIIPSKRLRNKIAGFTTHLMKRIQRAPVRGISLKLQVRTVRTKRRAALFVYSAGHSNTAVLQFCLAFQRSPGGLRAASIGSSARRAVRRGSAGMQSPSSRRPAAT